jgi:hypothetical protein
MAKTREGATFASEIIELLSLWSGLLDGSAIGQ